MFRKVIVPVDGSTFSEHALKYALPVVRASGGELDLVLVHVRQAPSSAELMLLRQVSQWELEHRQREAEYLECLGIRIRRETCVQTRTSLLEGDVVSSIQRHVRERDADLVVLTSHGRAGLERAWLGSVSDALLRHLDVPVLLVRPSDTEPGMRDGVTEYRHILIALDGSDRAERAIAPALALANADSSVTLIRVAAPAAASASPYLPHAVVLTRDQLEERRTAAQSYLRAAAQQVRTGCELDVKETVIVDYHPAHAILDYAEAHNIDLIAVGTRGRNPLSRMLLGSVSDKVVRAAATPVLVC